jgi:hypothetical protein
MRTTLDIDPLVLQQLKERQLQEGGPLGRLASELLARALAEQEPQPESAPFRWKTRDLGARVDLDDKDAVARALGDDEPV